MNCNFKPLVSVSLALAVFAAGAVRFINHSSLSATEPEVSSAQTLARSALGEAYSKLPLSFEANQGQISADAKFVARGNGGDAFLTSTGAVFALRSEPALQEGAQKVMRPHQDKGERRPGSSFRMDLVASNASVIPVGLEELPGKANYFVGQDASAWRMGVPTYRRVKYSNVYPGVDMVYYGNQRQLEYDFVIAAGANPDAIRLGFVGVDALNLNSDGDLVLRVAGREVLQKRPRIYQEVGTEKREIPGSYVLAPNHQVGFHLGAYDTTRVLVIDPVLVYSSYLGGTGYDVGVSIAVDGSGNAYITGFTNSTNFPAAKALQPIGASTGYQAFVAKMNAEGTALVYSTFLGGNADSFGQGIAVDAAGNAHVVGTTDSTNFPTAHALQPTYGGGFYDVFVAKLNAAGSALLYSTYLGGSQEDDGTAIQLDAAGNAYVTGYTDSSNFPTVNAFQSAFGGGGYDAFVAKLDGSGSALVYSTYLGGNDEDDAYAVAVDAGGNAYVAGTTASANFPVVNSFQANHAGGSYDAFVSKLNPAGSALVYSTFLGGSDTDAAFGIAVDVSGSAYVTGYTFSASFPTTKGAVQPTIRVASDAFVTKLSEAGSALVYSTFLGGEGGDYGNAIAVDQSGNAHVTGITSSRDFPVGNAPQPNHGGGPDDAFVAKLNADGSALVYSTFLGGSGDDMAFGIAVDNSGDAYVTGFTSSKNLATAGSMQATYGGGSYDGFAAKLGAGAPLVSSITPPAGAVSGNALVTLAGAHFLPGAAVTIGGVPATEVSVISTTKISARSGAHVAGVVDVTVINPNGQSFTLANGYTYLASPSIASIEPASGSINGGTPITVTGSNFRAGAQVQLDGVVATTIVVVNDTTITAVTGAHAAGAVDVQVTNLDGQSMTLSSAYTFLPAPIVLAIESNSGPTTGGTPVTITGSNFAPGAEVMLGNAPAQNVKVLDATTITAETIPHPAGTVDVRVKNSDGQESLVHGGFTFDDSHPSEQSFRNPGSSAAMGCSCQAGDSSISPMIALIAMLSGIRMLRRARRITHP